MDWTPSSIAVIGLIGLVGGCLGGLLGLGGSVFIIPAISLGFGPNPHLYQAAALIANVFVALAATHRHRGRGTIQSDILPTMAASAGLMALAGVFVSNLIEPRPLTALFGCFLLYAAANEVYALVRRRPDHEASERSPRQAKAIGLLAGCAGGFASGLLGIGGGAIMVPILRKHGRLPLRQAVATSAAAMIAACVVGATSKNLALHELTDFDGAQLTVGRSITLAAILSPMALVGGNLGAALVYRIPLDATRGVLACLLAFAGVRMLSLGAKSLMSLLGLD
jgi:uncharacterized membrane protein YfcA